MGRAVDIHPPDGALREKIHDCAFVRVNPKSNVEYLRRMAGGNSKKIYMTYDGYPLNDFRDASVPMITPYRILAVGRFARFKGFDVLLRAARRCADAGLDFRLTLVGSGARGIWLKALIKKLGIACHVSFPGFIPYDHITEFFSRADVFVMPSVIHPTGERDGIPNVLIEALLHRLPVVATNVAGIGEVIKDGETGLLVHQKDPWGLAQAIMRMTGDRESALRMAERGRDLVLKVFDPEHCHRKVLELFIKHMNNSDLLLES